jgi:Tol biopolymer transport system component
LVLFLSTAPLWPAADTNVVTDVYAWNGTRTSPVSLADVGPLTSVFGNARGIALATEGLYALEQRPRDDLAGPVRAFLWDLGTGQAEELPLPPNVDARAVAIANGGRCVAFTSAANMLDPAPGNGFSDVFRIDVGTGAITLVSATVTGRAANAPSDLAGASDDGRRIAFLSAATDLPLAGANGQPQAYLWQDDQDAPVLTRLALRPDGAPPSRVIEVALSADGSLAAFTSDDASILPGSLPGVVGLYATPTTAPAVERICVAGDGPVAETDCGEPMLSRDGRFVVFTSASETLAGTPTHGATQVFLRDRIEGTTQWLSTSSAGIAADADCHAPAISPSGRFVTFISAATNLVAEPPPTGVTQVYLVDRGETYANRRPQASPNHLVATRGAAVTISLAARDPDGDSVVFTITRMPTSGALCDGPLAVPFAQVSPDSLPWRLTDTEGRVTLVPPTAGFAGTLCLAFVASDAAATSAPAGIRVTYGDTDHGVIVRLDATTDGAEPNGPAAPDGTPGRLAISASGDRVVFSSLAANLTPGDANQALDVFLWDRHADVLERVSAPALGLVDVPGLGSNEGAISPDGRFVVFSATGRLSLDDTNSHRDIYMRDLLTVELTLVSRGPDGQPADGNSRSADVAANGALVVFVSAARNLVPEDSRGTDQIYLWERATGTIRLVSRGSTGEPASQPCANPRISADGSTIVFDSAADDLDGPTDGWRHVFRSVVATQQLTCIARPAPNTPLNGHAQRPTLSQTGRYVAFESDDTTLTPNDTNGHRDILLLDLLTGEVERVSRSLAAAQPDQDCFNAALSGDGCTVGFRSRSKTLAGPPAAGTMAAFLVDRLRRPDDPEQVRCLAHGFARAEPAAGDTWNLALSTTGRHVAFASDAGNLVPADTNSLRDAFLAEFSGRASQGAQLLLSQRRIAMAAGAFLCSLPASLFRVVAPDDPAAPTLLEVAYETMSTPVSGILRDTAGRALASGALLTSDAFPLVYETPIPESFAIVQFCLRAYAGEWQSQTVCLDVVVAGIWQDLRLETGWNLVAFTMQPLDTLPETLFGAYVSRSRIPPAWEWETQARTYRRAQSLTAGKGYWIYRDGPPLILPAIPGQAAAETTPVHAGWTLLGPIGPGHERPLPVASSGLPVIAWHWDNVAGCYRRPQALREGVGYWIHTPAPTTLDVAMP